MLQIDCDMSYCDYDLGECRIVPPPEGEWEGCSPECREKVLNNLCDPECYTVECHFDVGDCDLCRQGKCCCQL